MPGSGGREMRRTDKRVRPRIQRLGWLAVIAYETRTDWRTFEVANRQELRRCPPQHLGRLYNLVCRGDPEEDELPLFIASFRNNAGNVGGGKPRFSGVVVAMPPDLASGTLERSADQ